MRPIRTWILIANGARARVLEHAGRGARLSPVKNMDFSSETLSVSQIMADKAGRAFSSVGKSRSAMEQKTNPVDKREADFIKLVAQKINEKFCNKRFDRLVIFAAPHAMGDLRKMLSEEVKFTIIAEVAKDLTKVPNDEIIKHLENIMVV